MDIEDKDTNVSSSFNADKFHDFDVCNIQPYFTFII